MKIDTLRQSVIRAQPSMGSTGSISVHEGHEAERSLKDMFRILRRQLRFVLLVLAMMMLPIALYAIRLEPSYKSSASVVVESRQQLLMMADGSPAARPPDPAYLETLASVIRSRNFVSSAMVELDLFDDPEFLAEPPSLLQKTKALLGGSAERVGEPSQAEGTAGLPATSSPENDAALVSMAIFDDLLEVKPQNQSYVIKISFTSEDPVKAAKVANFMAERFIEEQSNEKAAAVQRAVGSISQRLEAAQAELERAEQQVAGIRLKTNVLPGQSAPVISVQSEELTRTLMRAKAEHALVTAKLQTIEEKQARGDSALLLPEISASGVISELRLQSLELQPRLLDAVSVYGENHPRAVAIRAELDVVQSKIDDEVDRVVSGIRGDAAIMVAQIEALEAQLDDARDRSLLDNATATLLENAISNAAVKRSLYEALLRRQEETSVQESWLLPDVRLISEASPPLKPSSLSRSTLIASGVTVTIILAFLLAFIRDHMNGSLHSSRQVEAELGLPCMGLLPKVKPKHDRSKALVSGIPDPSYTQAAGGVWVHLRIAKRAAKIVLVTSAHPQEGARSLSESLASCASQLDGLRTALVHFGRDDIARRGKTKDTDVIGVRNYLAAADTHDLSIEDIVTRDEDTGIDIFPAGSGARGAFQMTSEEALGSFLADLRDRYDVIFVSGPPVHASGDVSRLAHFADATILAVRWGETQTDTAKSALQSLLRASAHVVGIVLTEVDSRRQRLYGGADSAQYRWALRKQLSSGDRSVAFASQNHAPVDNGASYPFAASATSVLLSRRHD